jgi:aspartyl-tRNA(Asn)/glutamyl-tRNA(Gln) amidotransferase subunit A
MSVPCGFDAGGLPIGLQIIGKPLDEALMLQTAYVFEAEKCVKKMPDAFR